MKKQLTEDERLVLEPGLSFCPSQKNFNREKFADDTHAFMRCLKLKEYFYERSQTDEKFNNEKKKHSNTDKDRCSLNWNIKNPHWYPEAVWEGRSEGLVDFINSCTKDFSEHIHSKNNKHWNNLRDSQRQAIKSLSSDESIIIKPADKGNGIVIMNTNDYNEARLNILQDKEFYETVCDDPNPKYRISLDKIIDELKVNGYISETEEIRLKEGTRTPCFYGLPNIYKTFEKFPPLRPICSGYNSCSTRLSEWVDSFLKPAAMQTSSYIRDTTDFVNKIGQSHTNRYRSTPNHTKRLEWILKRDWSYNESRTVAKVSTVWNCQDTYNGS